MKKSFLVILLSLWVMATQAQSLKVKSFRWLEYDRTASSLEGKRIDQNGQVAALIKVVTNETGFVFEGGTLGIVDAQQQVSEVWVWVPRGLRKITIKHQEFGQLRDYIFPIDIEAERTYEMVLETEYVPRPGSNKPHQQYLAFIIDPVFATLEVDDKIWTVAADGSAVKYVNFGTYQWRVQAPNYHPEAGNITVNDPDNTQVVTVKLQPNFGWIEVEGAGTLRGASVYIDNALIGTAPCKSQLLKSGQHTVRIAKEMYNPYSETVMVRDNETTRLSPTLGADFAEVTLKVDSDAEIWVNNERKGFRSWSGPLGSGTYKIECKQANHETSLTTQEITASMAGQTITLPAPRPIYGSLLVESVPSFCKLFIDGQEVGTTPKSINEILIGQHEVKITKEGYSDYIEKVTITQGESKQVSATLSNTDYYAKGLEAYNKKDYAEAAKWFRPAAEQGNSSAQAYFGYMYNKGLGVTKDNVEAVKWYRKAAEQGNASAQCNMGVMYGKGYGVAKDYTEALKWYRKAAEQGYARGQCNLGLMYDMGYGVTKDYAEAFKWYRKAAEQGEVNAQCNLGIMYRDGKGVQKDYAEALKWFRKAVDQNYANAQCHLGYMYENGYGVTKDYKEAMKWYRKAAEQGEVYAQYNLGIMYEYGKGVTKSISEAKKWYQKAADQGYEDAKNKLKGLK